VHRFFISIAGIGVEIEDDARKAPEWLSGPWNSFVSSDTTNIVVTVTIRRNVDLPFGPPQPIGFSGSTEGTFFVHGWDFTAARERAGSAIVVEARPTAGLAVLLRWLYSVLLLEHNGLLLHAASGVIAGRGIAWAGPSRSGKTTLASLIADRCTLLTDEATAVRFEGAVPHIFATPFFGELGAISGAASSRLHSLLLLRPGRSFAMKELEPAKAAIRLQRATFVPLSPTVWRVAGRQAIDRLVASVASFDLAFVQTPDAVARLADLLS
jgi:hypothetical protein